MVLIALSAIVSTNLIYLEQETKASKDRKKIQESQKELDRDVSQLNQTITTLSAKETAAKNRDIYIQSLLEDFELKLNQLIKSGVADQKLLINLTKADSEGADKHRQETKQSLQDIKKELGLFSNQTS